MHLTNIVYSYTQVCDHFNTIIRGGGWNKKEETAKGRPTGKSTQLWLQSIAPASFFPDKPQTYDQSSYRLEGIFCTICMEIPEQPLQLECDHLVCLQCSCNWIVPHHVHAAMALIFTQALLGHLLRLSPVFLVVC